MDSHQLAAWQGWVVPWAWGFPVVPNGEPASFEQVTAGSILSPWLSFRSRRSLDSVAECDAARHGDTARTPNSRFQDSSFEYTQQSKGEANHAGNESAIGKAVLLAVDDQAATEQFLSTPDKPACFLLEGCWFPRPQQFQLPPPSATGRGVCGVGGQTDVSLSQVPLSSRSLIHPAQSETSCFPKSVSSFAFDAIGSTWLRAVVAHFGSLRRALCSLETRDAIRMVPFPRADAFWDSGMRVLQVVTTLQRGGAERVTLDITHELLQRQTFVAVASLGNPTREPFPPPTYHLDLGAKAPRRSERIPELLRSANRMGIDVIHGHLIDHDDTVAISRNGWPLMLTIHNTSAAWPTGTTELKRNDASLLVGCAMAIEADLDEAGLPVAQRTVWNGICTESNRAGLPTANGDVKQGSMLPASEIRQHLARDISQTECPSIRETWNVPRDAIVVLSVANPRPQKRLHLLPGVVAELQKLLAGEGDRRLVYLVLAGEASRNSTSAAESIELIEQEIARLGLVSRALWLGSVIDLAPVYAAADVVVTTSAHEGLSLAHQEALAAGVPVVSTAVGGTEELNMRAPVVSLLDPTADSLAFACVIHSRLKTGSVSAADKDASRPSLLSRDFERGTMAGRYRWLYPRVFAAHARASARMLTDENWDSAELPVLRSAGYGNGVLLITNNFSMGGAQSSARRLLAEWARRGVRVAAVVLQEQPEYPTPGTQALRDLEIPVTAVRPVGTITPEDAVQSVLAIVDQFQPGAVLLWNAISLYKILIVDGLWDIPVYDVSPGEMYYDSLQKYFANPRTGLPYRTQRDYGKRLASVVVKYHREQQQAQQNLGCKTFVIPNGVPLPTGQHRLRDMTHRELVIGTAARISPQKRLEDLLVSFRMALPHLPPCRLKIAGRVEQGADEYAVRLKELANGLPVEWVGELASTEQFLEELDLFAMISAPAGCPNALLEALAYGLPVVATDVGGASEQVIHRETGLLVAHGDIDELSLRLVELAQSKRLQQQLGHNARSHIAKHFALDLMVDRYSQLMGIPVES